jgi:RNase adaptor protein for sRNA GlmZ degradation
MSKKLLKKVNLEDSLVIDARTIVNPHSDYPDINGLHPHVQLFICRQKGFLEYITNLVNRVKGAHETNVVFFCDAGMHRSVFLADILTRIFTNSSANHLSLKPSKHDISIKVKDLLE